MALGVGLVAATSCYTAGTIWAQPPFVQSRKCPSTKGAPVTQGTEQRTSNPRLGGSHPPGRAIVFTELRGSEVLKVRF